MPCCGRTPFEVPRDDRMTLDESLVTCYGGYPKAAVERAAKAYREAWAKWWRNGLGLESEDLDADEREVVLAAIRAFHNEGSEQ